MRAPRKTAVPPAAASAERPRVMAIRPEGPCFACKGTDYRLVTFDGVEAYVCSRCHPEAGKGGKTLVLDSTPSFTGPREENWVKMSRVTWARILKEATAAGQTSRMKYARWILDVVLV